MKAVQVLLCTAILSTPVYSTTYLCIGEQVGVVGDRDGEILKAQSQSTSDKFLVSERGVQIHGTDNFRFDHCDMNNGRPGWCTNSGVYQGVFRLSNDYIFSYYGIMLSDGVLIDFIMKGKCTALSD